MIREGSTRLTYTGLCGGLEHLQIETRLTDERFASVMGEGVIWTLSMIYYEKMKRKLTYECPCNGLRRFARPWVYVYYESTKRKRKIKTMYETIVYYESMKRKLI